MASFWYWDLQMWLQWETARNLFSSKMDPLLAEAEVISNSGSTSEITDWRRGKHCCVIAAEEGRKNMWDTALQAPRLVKTEWQKVLKTSGQRFPRRPWGRLVSHSFFLQPVDVNHRADVYMQPLRTPRWSRWFSKGGSDSVGIPIREQAPGRICDHTEASLWSNLFLNDYIQWKGHTLEHFVKNCRPYEGEHELPIIEIHGGLSSVGGICWNWGSMWRFLPLRRKKAKKHD